MNYKDILEQLIIMFPGRVTVSVKEAAKALGTHEHLIYKSIREDKDPIPFSRVGKKYLIPLAKLAKWIADGGNHERKSRG